MKLIICISLILGNLNGFGQNQKLTKEQRADLSLASQSIKIDLIKGDTVKLLRAPVSSIKSSEKYFIDALQKRLEEVNSKIKGGDELEIGTELYEIKKFISQIETSDSNWPSNIYKDELNVYFKFYKKAASADSLKELNDKGKDDSPNISNSKSNSESRSSNSQRHEVQTGPRGGQYYINKNGKKTYVKTKR